MFFARVCLFFATQIGGVNEKGRLPSRIDRDFKSRLAIIWSKMVPSSFLRKGSRGVEHTSKALRFEAELERRRVHQNPSMCGRQ